MHREYLKLCIKQFRKSLQAFTVNDGYFKGSYCPFEGGHVIFTIDKFSVVSIQ